MASTGERVASLGFALLVCLSLIGGGVAPSPVGTATAQAGDGSGGPCDASDWFLTMITGTIITTDCKTAPEVAEEWNETDADQTRTQIHSQAGQLRAGNEQFLTAMNNAVIDSDTIAFSKGEAAAVEVLANGGTVSEAQQAANESIEDYYSIKQQNLLDRWEVSIETSATLTDRARQTTGVDNYFVSLPDGSGGDAKYYLNSTSATTIQLTNGSTAQVQGMVIADSEGQSNPILFTSLKEDPDGPRYESSWNNYGKYISSNIRVDATSNLTSKNATDTHKFDQSWQSIETKKQSTKQEVAVYIEQSLGPAVENGNLNATNYISPSTLAQEYATEYKNSTSYVDATALAAYSGMSTPDLNNTGSMTVTHNGTTYQGLLLSQNAPDAGWESGETYDPALLSGMQLFAVAGENGRIIELDGPFTIEEISGPSGDPISTADTVEVTYETANTSEDYAALQEEIRTLNEQYEERKAQATGGGSDTTTNTNLLDQLAAALGVSVGAAVVVVGGVVVIAARFYLQ